MSAPRIPAATVREFGIELLSCVLVVPLLRLDTGGGNHLTPSRGFGLVVFGERGDRAADASQVVIAEILLRLRRIEVLVDGLVPPLRQTRRQRARAVDGKPGGGFEARHARFRDSRNV